jgi:hypothetical protein
MPPDRLVQLDERPILLAVLSEAEGGADHSRVFGGRVLGKVSKVADHEPPRGTHLVERRASVLHASADRDRSDRTIMITGIGDVIT